MATGSIQQSSNLPHKHRDDGIVFIAAYHFLVSGMFVLATVIFAFPTILLAFIGATQAAGAFIGMFAVGLIAAVMMVFCLLYLVIGYGLWTLRPWARVAAIAVAVISLFAFPLGTVIGALILWYLLKPEIADLFQ